MNWLNEYCCWVYTVISYYQNLDNSPETRQVLMTDTCKCLVIGASLGLAIRYSLGKCHYLRYVRNMGLGGMFGLSYSFYFTNQKVEAFQARKELGLPLIDDTSI